MMVYGRSGDGHISNPDICLPWTLTSSIFIICPYLLLGHFMMAKYGRSGDGHISDLGIFLPWTLTS